MNFARNKLFSVFLSHNKPNTPLPTFVLYQGKKTITTYLNYLNERMCKWIVEDLLHLYDCFKTQSTIVIGINYTKDLLVKLEQIFSSASIIIQKYYYYIII